MDDFMKNFDGVFNGAEIPENVKEMLNNFIQNSKNSEQTSDVSSSNTSNVNSNIPSIDMDTVIKIQKIVQAMNSEQSSSRVNLLRSLKPYLNPSRRDKVEEYIRLLNIEKAFELFNNGGDKNEQSSTPPKH